MTIFCSSTRKARTIRSRTAVADSTPPYARDTDFLFFAMCLLEYFCFASRGTYAGREGKGQGVEGGRSGAVGLTGLGA